MIPSGPIAGSARGIVERLLNKALIVNQTALAAIGHGVYPTAGRADGATIPPGIPGVGIDVAGTAPVLQPLALAVPMLPPL